ncbi:MAG: hypothetical protein E7233_11140 [Lachnospiraceae bacterium]|nr:hypothetical protein [Lachnospiraceae bacterium]
MNRRGLIVKVAAVFLILQMMIGVIPVQSLAEPESTEQETVITETSEYNDAEESSAAVPESTVAIEVTEVTEDTSETSESSVTSETTETTSPDAQKESTSEDASLPETEGSVDLQEEPSVETEIKATSRTNNIIGEIFSNQINMANAEGEADKRAASLEQYPLEHHELDYYGDSERVRFIDDENKDKPNYLVYRDSFLLISEEESKNYTVLISEEGDKAWISPALSPEILYGKTGLVFLADEVKNDSILVFAAAPEYKDDLLIVSIKPTEEITVNEIFSDGRLAFGQQKKAMLKASTPIVTDPRGTNWSGSITSFKINDIRGTTDKEIFDLYLTVGIHLEVEMDFDITATGATGKKESARIASINIPVELFDITVRYNLVVEFDENPMHVKGTIRPSFNYLLKLPISKMGFAP